jgi:lysophospholipid acyltransferase (LPLAT)-like uncharacterized protein
MTPRARQWLTECKWRLVGVLGKLLIDLIFCASRIEVEGYEKVRHLRASRRVILAFWHSRILLISYLFQRENALILVSRSKDGEIIARILQRQGHEPLRGSSSRGGLRALSAMIRKMKQSGRPAVVIPDGPRGPRYRVQPGVITLARKTGFPIVAVTYSARHRKVFNSWDRFILPAPLTRCKVVFGDPLSVPSEIAKGEETHYANLLQAELRRITARADAAFGQHTL